MTSRKGKGFGFGTSKLDNASAACSHFLIRENLKNPFHHAEVRSTRQSFARIKTQLGDQKVKAGEAEL